MHCNKTYTQSLIMDFHVDINNPTPRLILGFLIYLFLATLFLNTSTTTLVESCMEEERQALLSFKDDLTDPSGRLSSWVGHQCCEWRGVSCNNRTGHVVKLDIRNPYRYTYSEYRWNDTEYDRSYLQGISISPSLLGLKHLSYLDLSNNDFNGIKIPRFMGQLTGLSYLNLSYSNFTGEIPHSLGNLSNLNYLDFSGADYYYYYYLLSKDLNWLSHLSSLKYLNLDCVDLNSTGESLLHSVNKLPSLLELHLSSCHIHNIPQSLRSSINFTSLEVLDISNNFLTNPSFPKWIFNLSSLTTLDASGNSFRDLFVDEFTSLKSLEHLDLTSMELKGQLPKLTGKVCELKSLRLAHNSLDGGVKEFFSGFSNCSSNKLESLDLSENYLVDELPSSLGNLKNLQHLDLSENSFNGSLPESLGHLSQLVSLDLGFNRFNGSLPESLGHLSQLVSLDLSSNLWEGNLTEAHFINLTSLKTFSFMVTSSMSLNIHVGSLPIPVNVIDNDWIPRFQLRELHMSSCRVGPRFPKWLQSQTNLIYLQLSNVGISSPIPHEWLSKISSRIGFFDLSHNQITGKLPFNFIFPLLWDIDLSHNQFHGPLELSSTNAPKLWKLWISYNHLNGTIPSSICTIQSLQFLVLRTNHFSGKFPKEWGLWEALEILDVSNNSLSGEIPTSMGIPSFLTILRMDNNNFSGKIPSSLQNCSSLRKLHLGGNNFNGTIPSWMGSTTTFLEVLMLRSNFFSGHIPLALCYLYNLRLLDLGQNNLSGTIPKCLVNLTSLAEIHNNERNGGVMVGDYSPTAVNVKGGEWEYDPFAVEDLTIIDFSSNRLEGDIPQEICGILGLNTLNFSMNQLSGNIPSKIGNLYWIESLDLSQNQLSGQLPQSLSKLTFLSHFNVSYNNLTGRIPSGSQLQTFDVSIYEGNPSLCGFPLLKCAEDNMHEPHVQEKKDHHDNDEDKFGFYTSATLGFITGFWCVCGTLILKKAWRYAYFRFFDNIKEKIALTIALRVTRFQRRN